MSKKKRLILIIAFSILVVIITVINIIKGGSTVNVEVAEANRGKIEQIVSAPGKIHALKEVNINSDIMGKLVKLYVEEGDWIKENHVLAKLDSTEQFAAYQRALANVGANKADLEFKEQQYQRKKKLYDKGLISRENFENIATSVEVARLNLENARTELRRTKKRLEKTTIRTPISGTVMSVQVEEGENVITGTMNNPGTVLLTVSNLDAMECIADVNESEVPLISIDDNARVFIEAFPDTEFIGKVYNIASMPKSLLTSETGAVEFEVKISLPHHPGMLPGMSSSCEIITDAKEDALRVPLQSVVTEENKKGVYKVKNGLVEFTPVSTGITESRWAEIIEGLEEGDLIVKGPLKILMKLTEKQKVSYELEKEDDTEIEEEGNNKEKSESSPSGTRRVRRSLRR